MPRKPPATSSLDTLDGHCRKTKKNITPWKAGGEEARTLMQNVIDKKNGGVSMQDWPLPIRQRIAKWLKRERGVTLYLQRKRTQVKNHKGDFIPYYIDADHAAILGLRKTPRDATPYTHSLRATPSTTRAPHQHQPQQAMAESEEEYRFYEPYDWQEGAMQDPVQDDTLPLPPLPMPFQPDVSNSSNNCFDYGANFTDGQMGLPADFSSYYYYPAEPLYFALPPVDITNHAFNVVS